MKQMIQELARYVVGWREYFGFCETPWVLRALDSWIRRRVRCAFWLQWKTSRKRYAELVRRGVGAFLAHCTAGSNHGSWHLSRSQALSFALPNACLKSLGVPSLEVR